MQRFSRETKDTDVKINSICKFEFVDRVKSKDDLNKELIKEGFNEKDVISIN